MCFGIVGSAFMDALDLFPTAGIRFLSVQHEQNVYLADILVSQPGILPYRFPPSLTTRCLSQCFFFLALCAWLPFLFTWLLQAAHMADGYYRASGKTGVCIAQNGPGISNFVTGASLLAPLHGLLFTGTSSRALPPHRHLFLLLPFCECLCASRIRTERRNLLPDAHCSSEYAYRG